MELQLSRRALLKAGLSAAFVSLLPEVALAGEFSSDETGVIGAGAFPEEIYQPTVTGEVDAATLAALLSFAKSAIEAWGFHDVEWDERKDIQNYPENLKTVIGLKTMLEPSYLAEYKSAAGLVIGARSRLGTDASAFVHLMFAGRDKGDRLRAPRLMRARRFVFDEFTRYLLSSGGFRSFGFVNFPGYMSGSLYDPKSFRRSVP